MSVPEVPVCRICRTAEGGNLVRPCRCDGSIRFVHEECLDEWLQYRQQDTCELCGTQFEFEPLYAENTPSRLGAGQLAVGGLFKAGSAVVFLVRIVLAFVIWTLCAPLAAYAYWRLATAKDASYVATFLMEVFPSLDHLPAYTGYGAVIAGILGLLFLCIASLRDNVVSPELLLEGYESGDIALMCDLRIPESVEALISDLDRDVRPPETLSAQREGRTRRRAEGVPAVERTEGDTVHARRTPNTGMGIDEGLGGDAAHAEEGALQAGGAEAAASAAAPAARQQPPQTRGTGYADDNRLDRDDASPSTDEGEGPRLRRVGADPRGQGQGRRDIRRSAAREGDAEAEGDGTSAAGGGPRASDAAAGRADAHERPNGETPPGNSTDARTRAEEFPEQQAATVEGESDNDNPVEDLDAELAAELAEQEDDDFDNEDLGVQHAAVLEALGVTGPFSALVLNAVTLAFVLGCVMFLLVFVPFHAGRLIVAVATVAFSTVVDGFAAAGVLLVFGDLTHEAAVWEDTLFGPTRALGSTAAELLSTTGGLMGMGYLAGPLVLHVLLLANAHAIARADASESARERHMMLQRLLLETARIAKLLLVLSSELVLVPLAGGFLLDACTVELFGTSMDQRLAGVKRAPLTMLFIHWVFGMVYMFATGMSITMLRVIVRRGVLWAFRNPDHPNFRPVRAIVNESPLRHVRRVLVTLLLYIAIVLLFVRVPVVLVTSSLSPLLPLRLPWVDVIYQLPADMLVLHISLPLLARFTRPVQTVRKFVQWALVEAAFAVGIGDYLLPHSDSDHDYVAAQPLRLFGRPLRSVAQRMNPEVLFASQMNAAKLYASYTGDGSFVASLEARRGTSRSGEMGTSSQSMRSPSPRARRSAGEPEQLSAVQDDARERMARKLAFLAELMKVNHVPTLVIDEEVTRLRLERRIADLVPHPSRFALRLAVFLALLWAVVVCGIITVLTLPVLLGRVALSAALGGDANLSDVHAFAVGGWLLLAAAKAVRLSRLGAADVSRRLVFLFNLVNIVLPVAFALPLLIGKVVDVLLVTPLAVPLGASPLFLPMRMWSIGTFVEHATIGYVLAGHDPEENGRNAAAPASWRTVWKNRFAQLQQRGIRQLSLRLWWGSVVAPIAGALLAVLAIHTVTQHIIMAFLPGHVSYATAVAAQRTLPLLVCAAAALIVGAFPVSAMWEHVHESVRNDRYLVGRRLRAYERAAEQSSQ